MAYVPGSHLAGPLRVVDITHTTEPYDILADPALNGAQPETVVARPGSVIWHQGFTVHRASANETDHTRRVFTVVYIAAGWPRVKPWPTFPLDRAGVEVGALMAGEGLPPVWPPPDHPPAPPARLGEQTGPQYRV